MPLHEAQAIEAVQVAVRAQLEQQREVQAAQAPVIPSGSHTDWMAAAGIDPANYGYVDYIVGHESGWDPCSFNPGQHNCSASPVTACGIGQQLPCGKWPGAWNDPIAGLRAMNSYVMEYGGWSGAYAHWLAYHSY